MAHASTQNEGKLAPDARKLALSVLMDARKSGQDASLILHRALGQSTLEARDRGFATMLVMQTLRHIHVIDAMLAQCFREPILEVKSPFAVMALRLGVVQILWLETSAHAAVNETVELVKASPNKALSGLVNAVLKRIAREGKTMLAQLDVEHLAIADWLWKSWVATYGEQTTRAIARQIMQAPAIDLSIKNKEMVAHWAQELGATLLPSDTVRLPAGVGDVRALAGYTEGAWWVQDISASLPAKLLAKQNLEGKMVLDLCAAPGGKTAQLAAMGAEVTAVDRSGKRLEQLHENLKRLGLEAATEEADILKWRPKTRPDAILLDAICTATGTLRRQPDVAMGKSAADVKDLSAIQRKMLDRALSWLKPGGRLVYCVCSLEKAEGEAHIEPILKDHADVRLEAVTPEELPDLAMAITPDGCVRTLPHYLAEQGGMDGFFMARFIKV